MNENQAFIILRDNLLAAFVFYGYGCKVLAGRQPTAQLLEDNAVYMFSPMEKESGQQWREYVPTETDAIGHTEKMKVIKTVQVQAFLKRSPDDFALHTAADLCRVARMILKSLPFIEITKPYGLGLSGFSALRTPEFINAEGNYQQNPSFDFDLSFDMMLKPATKAIIGINTNILGV